MKMIKFSGQYGENERQWKRKRAGTQETKFFVRTWDVPSKKRVTRTFHAVVVQDNDKEMQKKKCAARAKLLLLLMRRVVVFFCLRVCFAVLVASVV